MISTLQNESFAVYNVSRLGNTDTLNRIAILEFKNAHLVNFYINEVGNNDEDSILKQEDILYDINEILERVDYFVCNRSGTHRGLLNGTYRRLGMTPPRCNYFGVTEAETVFERFEKKINTEKVKLTYKEENFDGEMPKAYNTLYRLELLMDSIGIYSLEQIVNFMKERAEQKTASFFRSQIGDNPDNLNFHEVSSDASLNGLTVMVTGNFEKFPNRKDLEALILQKGGRLVTSISKKINIVFVGQEAGPSKLKKIEELQSVGVDIKMIKEDDIEKFL